MHQIVGNKIVYDSDRVFRMLLPIDFGSTSNIYKLKISGVLYAVKIFNGEERTNLYDIQNKQKINIDSYISPIKLLYVNEKFIGYVMRFCKDKNLAKRPLDLSINRFASDTIKLIKDTNELTNLRYNIFDGFLTNGMYDDGFRMIDMDDYTYEPNKSFSEVEFLNNKRLNLFLKDVFEKNTGLDNIEDEYIKSIMKKCEKGEILFDEVFNIICTLAYNITDTELNNISDIGKVLIKK